MAFHIAASKGNENCVLLLLDFGADPNCRDSEGSVPLWEAMVGMHKPVVNLLSDNGAKLTAGDVGLFSCTAAEQNKFELLKEIIRFGGDITRSKSNGCTALHIAVCEGNVEIVKFLLDHGANIDQPDESGWTARDLAEQQGHDDIKELFESYKAANNKLTLLISEERHGVRFLGRHKSEPTMLPLIQDGQSPAPDGSWGRSRPLRRTNNFYNSLFGILSAAKAGENNMLLSSDNATNEVTSTNYAARVNVAGKLVLLPQTFEELFEIAAKNYGFWLLKVLNKDGALIEGIELIRDGDHLVFASELIIIKRDG